MKPDNLRSVRFAAALAMSAMMFAPASPAADLFGVHAVAGMPQLRVTNGQALTWRNVGVVAESDLVDAEAKVTACSSAVPPAALGIPDAPGSGCGSASGPGTDFESGHRLSATLKIPRWHAEAPLVDLTLRSWRSPMHVAGRRDGASGSAAELAFTHPLGSIDAFYGYSTPLASSINDGRWRSAFVGLSWRAAKGTTIEFVADRGTETATGVIDRTLTLRIFHASTAQGIRLGVFATRALDDPSGAVRASLGIDYTF